jgi:hypothetical protein
MPYIIDRISKQLNKIILKLKKQKLRQQIQTKVPRKQKKIKSIILLNASDEPITKKTRMAKFEISGHPDIGRNDSCSDNDNAGKS